VNHWRAPLSAGRVPNDSAHHPDAHRALPPASRSPKGEETKGEAASRRLAGWGHTLSPLLAWSVTTRISSGNLW
jgi:hypothetical protein